MPKIKKEDDDTDKLYKAVQNYIEGRGGKLLIIGGVEIIEMPDDNKGIFHFAIKCMGKRPEKINENN